MAKLHHKISKKNATRPDRQADPESLAATIATFVKTRIRPAVLDFGDRAIPLLEGRYAIEVRSGGLWIEAWDEERSLKRRIFSIDRTSSCALDCTVQRFAGATGSLTFLDLERPQAAARSIRGVRREFRRTIPAYSATPVCRVDDRSAYELAGFEALVFCKQPARSP